MNDGDKMVSATDGVVLFELPLGDAFPTFNFEKSVCSHGLFMMAPNHWDTKSKTLIRPIRINSEKSVMVHVSHPPQSPHVIHVEVLGTQSLCPDQKNYLLSQVRRMLRLSDEENRRVKEFQEAHEEAKERGFGRLFRSPTLFEDMIKCILLCNCQWSRTLSMAQALCELQLELQPPPISRIIAENETIAPKTPVKNESNKISGLQKCSTNLANRYTEDEPTERNTKPKTISTELQNSNCDFSLDFPILEGKKVNSFDRIGNFPTPEELASLDEKFLANRCKLGYRAGRIINLAREIVNGKIILKEFKDSCDLSEYDAIKEKLKVINGFGPFTCSNVLMCMGFYHVIPTDSETVRHMKQVHGRRSTIKTVQGDVEKMYAKYAPFQFLAYWSEIWHFYEEWFGKLGEMSVSSYKFITAANMKTKGNGKIKRMKLSQGQGNMLKESE